MTDTSTDKIKVYEFVDNNTITDYQDKLLVEIIDDLQLSLAKVPTECVNLATIEFNGYDEYVEYDIYYLRDETDDEYAIRMRQIEVIDTDIEQAERETYQRLHKKFGKEVM